MIAVITGDIINSRKVKVETWQPKLKAYFSKISASAEHWEIYRGDSFQIAIKADKALEIALCIKSLIKYNSLIDVRMSIGIGNDSVEGEKVNQSVGTAHINSGESFEKLKSQTLIIKTPFPDFDEYFNSILKLVSFISNSWKPATSETIFEALTNRNLMQKEIAEKLNKDSTTVNKALKRGAYDEILEVIDLYSKKINQCLN